VVNKKREAGKCKNIFLLLFNLVSKITVETLLAVYYIRGG
jgi:hypothetical protein